MSVIIWGLAFLCFSLSVGLAFDRKQIRSLRLNNYLSQQEIDIKRKEINDLKNRLDLSDANNFYTTDSFSRVSSNLKQLEIDTRKVLKHENI
jgi:hypothetical protein